MNQVFRRGRKHITYKDDVTGLLTTDITIHDQHYLDDNNLWQPVVEDLETDGIDGFSQKADKMQHKIRLGDDGKRRWFPRRNVNEYIEFGLPEYWNGTTWQSLTLGTPVKDAHSLFWDKTNFSFKVSVNWHRVKLDIVLKNSAAAKRVRWPVSLSGLTWNNWNLVGQDGTNVGKVEKIIGADANNTVIPITNSYSSGYVEFTADLTSAVYPVSIDPTLDTQPDATAGIDANIINGDVATYNFGVNPEIGVGEANDSLYTRRTLIKFDLSSINDTDTISSTTLSLYCTLDYSSNARTFRVYRLKRAWVEGTNLGTGPDSPATGVTWNRYDTTNNWETAGGFGSNDCEQTEIGSRAFTATETVSAFKDFSLTGNHKSDIDLGNGWLIKADTELDDQYRFSSSDDTTAANRPHLVIVYSTTISVTPSVNLVPELLIY